MSSDFENCIIFTLKLHKQSGITKIKLKRDTITVQIWWLYYKQTDLTDVSRFHLRPKVKTAE